MGPYEIRIVTNGVEGTAIAVADWRGGNDLGLRLEVNGVSHQTVAYGCLTAFNVLRSEYFPDVEFLCNGARRNFIQSGMLLSSGGFGGYLVRIGDPSSKETAFIFDYCPRELIASVAEQKAFKKEFFEFLTDEQN
jgi:hypothetical protein